MKYYIDEDGNVVKLSERPKPRRHDRFVHLSKGSSRHRELEAQARVWEKIKTQLEHEKKRTDVVRYNYKGEREENQ